MPKYEINKIIKYSWWKIACIILSCIAFFALSGCGSTRAYKECPAYANTERQLGYAVAERNTIEICQNQLS